jgi:hypothetical protein
MQTFLPISTTIKEEAVTANPGSNNMETILQWASDIARQLDNKRLFKQALEGWQILMNLTELDPQNNYRKPAGWSSHPAVKMWRGSELILYFYIQAMINEWKARGFKTTLANKALTTIIKAKEDGKASNLIPAWMRNQKMFDAMASSHRKALLSKHYEHYNQFNWPEDEGFAPESFDYVWPIKGGKDVNDKGVEVAA